MMWIAKGGQKMLVDPGTLPYWESLGWQVDADANAVGDLTQQSAAYVAVRRTGSATVVQTDVFTRRLDPTLRLKVAATPPTITYGATFGSSSISSNVTIAATDTRLRRMGAIGGSWFSFVSGAFTYYQAYAATSNENSLAQYEFETDAPVVEVNMFGSTTDWNMTVDGELVSGAAMNASLAPASKANGNRYFTKIDFGSRQPRRIRIFGRTLIIADFRIGPNDTLWSPQQPAGPRLGFMMDSYGQRLSYAAAGIAFTTAELLGLHDLAISPVGGTGYLNNNTTYQTFRGRLSDLTAAAPDILVTAGGLNDQGRQTKATLTTETTAYAAAVRAAMPSVVHVATGPWAPSQTAGATANYTDVRDAILAGLQAGDAGGPWLFIDNLAGTWTHSDGRTGSAGGGPWQTGTGKVGTTTGTGNGDIYVSSDGTHPQEPTTIVNGISAWAPNGVDYLAWRLASAMASGLAL